MTEETWAWPTHYLMVLVHLARKPQGGDRALLCYHLSMRARERHRKTVVAEWSESWSQWWDQAIAGSSALQAAFGRLLSDEVHAALGWHIAAGLTDIKGFYDHVLWGNWWRRPSGGIIRSKSWHFPCRRSWHRGSSAGSNGRRLTLYGRDAVQALDGAVPTTCPERTLTAGWSILLTPAPAPHWLSG